ncbi:phosphotransferase, partial [Streptomyces alkaliphilus]|nr:phosphotransferase [Streptomyces alkaliphilus]
WGGVLRAFHALPPPVESDGLVLPGYDAFDRTARRLRTPPAGVTSTDTAFLRGRLVELRERVAELRFPSSPVPVHGDAHRGNALVEPSGRVVLLDPDGVCLDHPEWDLLPMVTDARRTGWCGPQELRAFLRGYRDAGDGRAPRVAGPDWA